MDNFILPQRANETFPSPQLHAVLGTLKSGSLLQALVTEVTLLTKDDQKNLQQLLQKQLATLSQNLKTPSATKHAQGLEARIALLENAQRTQTLLNLLTLKVGKHDIKTLSEKPVLVGDKLNLQVRPDGQLSRLDTNADRTKRFTPNSSDETKVKQQQLKTLLANELRQNLPLGALKPKAFDTLAKLATALTQIDGKSREQIFPKISQQLLSKVLSNILQVDKLGSSVQIKRAIENSGSFLEAKLQQIAGQPAGARLAQSTSQSTSQRSNGNPFTFNTQTNAAQQNNPLAHAKQNATVAAPTYAGNTKNTLNEANPRNAPLSIPDPPNKSTVKTQAQPLTTGTQNAGTQQQYTAATKEGRDINTTPAKQTAIRDLDKAPNAQTNTARLEDDIKSNLLKLISVLSATSSANNPLANKPLTQNTTDPLLAILKSLGVRSQKGASAEAMQKLFFSEVKLLLNSTLARIQTMQLRPLIHTTNDPNSNILPGVELALRVNDNVFPILLFFQEKRSQLKKKDDEEEAKKRQQKRIRQWKVFMQFDMDECGWFASEVSLQGETVSSRFWAQTPSTQSKLRSRLDNLKEKMMASGLDVDQLTLLPGEPPQQQTLQNNLVDIQT